MLLCLFLCSLPVALPVVLHLATVVVFALGFGVDPTPLAFAPYAAPVAIVAPYVAPERPSIRMPSPPCRVAVARLEARAYPLPVLRAPRTASGRFGRVEYSGSEVSYNLSLTVSA